MLTKNIKISFLHSPRIDDDNVHVRVSKVVKQPIKTIMVKIVFPMPLNKDKIGMAERKDFGF